MSQVKARICPLSPTCPIGEHDWAFHVIRQIFNYDVIVGIFEISLFTIADPADLYIGDIWDPIHFGRVFLGSKPKHPLKRSELQLDSGVCDPFRLSIAIFHTNPIVTKGEARISVYHFNAQPVIPLGLKIFSFVSIMN